MKNRILLITICIFLDRAYSAFSQSLPIKPARTASFMTTEGTYMDVDVSPDGKTIVFDILGDLYLLPITGGHATQITRGLALNLKPVWSPNGRKIAYISDFSGAFHVNVRDISGKFHKVLGASDQQLDYAERTKWYTKGHSAAENPVWTTGGQSVAIDNLLYGLWGSKRQFHSEIGHIKAFSSDGRLIYYIDSGRFCSYNLNTNKKDILLKSSLGSKKRLIKPR